MIFSMLRVESVGGLFNGLALGAVADFGAQNYQPSTKVDAR